MAKKYTETHYAILVYLIGVLVQWLYFKGYVFHPNNFIVSYGGDPLVIYTDMINHICHGSGIYLDFMNYPYGESIFMTDMQASFTLVFGWINNLVDICDIIPGLIHGSIMWLMPLTGMFMYLSFRKLGTTNWVSILFSLLIAYLSPQIIRFLGQLSLAYPFLVPLSIYWFLDLYDRSKLSWKDMFFGFVLFFFMLNNAYTGIIAAATLLGGGLILLSRKQNQPWVRKCAYCHHFIGDDRLLLL